MPSIKDSASYSFAAYHAPYPGTRSSLCFLGDQVNNVWRSLVTGCMGRQHAYLGAEMVPGWSIKGSWCMPSKRGCRFVSELFTVLVYYTGKQTAVLCGTSRMTDVKKTQNQNFWSTAIQDICPWFCSQKPSVKVYSLCPSTSLSSRNSECINPATTEE